MGHRRFLRVLCASAITGCVITSLQVALADPEGEVNLPPRDEILKSIKANLCAPTFTERKNQGSKTQLEASPCADCATADVAQQTGLKTTAEQVRALFTPLRDEEDKAWVKRDLAFFRSPWGKEFLSEYGANKPIDEQLKIAESKKEIFVKQKEDALEQKAKAVKKNAALKAVAAGQNISAEEKATLDEHFQKSLGFIENDIKKIKDSIESMKKSAKLGSKNAQKYVDLYEANVVDLEKKQARAKKALEGSTDQATLEFYATELSNLKNLASYDSQIGFLEKEILNYTKEIQWLEKKIKEKKVQNENLDAPTLASELEDTERKILSALSYMIDRADFRTCGMSVAEATMIRYYTGSGYEEINRNLREGGSKAEAVKPAVDVLNAALKKLSRYKGPVKRGITVPKADLESYQVGKVITFPSYTSTSLSGGWKGNLNFVIHSKTGRYVGVHSNYEGEDEVLIAPGAKFKVLDRKESNGDVEVILDEIDPKIRPLQKGDTR